MKITTRRVMNKFCFTVTFEAGVQMWCMPAKRFVTHTRAVTAGVQCQRSLRGSISRFTVGLLRDGWVWEWEPYIQEFVVIRDTIRYKTEEEARAVGLAFGEKAGLVQANPADCGIAR